MVEYVHVSPSLDLVGVCGPHDDGVDYSYFITFIEKKTLTIPSPFMQAWVGGPCPFLLVEGPVAVS